MMSTPYRPAWWLPGPHAQTLWGKVARRRALPDTRRIRLDTPDGDFVDLHRVEASSDRPRVLILHGLEGSVRSHYVQGIFREARSRDWGADVLIFRSCGNEQNRLPRSYHSGETGDLAFVAARLLDEFPRAPLTLVGFSLGGNVLLKWLGESGDALPTRIAGAAAVSVPYDLDRACARIHRGFSRIYERHFLRTLGSKARATQQRFPGILTGVRVEHLGTLRAFDDAVTAPLHGFRDAADYYARSSALGFLHRIRRPTLLLSAVDDPFLPGVVLDAARDRAGGNPSLRVEFEAHGGHVGFVSGVPWRPFYHAERRAMDFLAECLSAALSPPGSILATGVPAP
jgi:uncharacterized protein